MRKTSKLISLVSLFVFFFVIFAIFKMGTKLNFILSTALSVFFVFAPAVMKKIGVMYSKHYLKQMRADAVRGFRITEEEANKLFYLNEESEIVLNRSQLEKCNIPKESKEMIIFAFESP